VLNWGSAFLPAQFQGTPLGNASIPSDRARVRYIESRRMPRELQRMQLDLLADLNRDHLGAVGPNLDLEARLDSFELAFRMQAAIPEVQSIADESPGTLRPYGLDDPVTNRHQVAGDQDGLVRDLFSFLRFQRQRRGVPAAKALILLPQLGILPADLSEDLHLLNGRTHGAHGLGKRGIDRGEFRAVDLDVAIYLVLSPMMFLMMWRHSLGCCAPDVLGQSPEKYLQLQADVLLHGLCATAPSSCPAKGMA